MPCFDCVDKTIRFGKYRLFSFCLYLLGYFLGIIVRMECPLHQQLTINVHLFFIGIHVHHLINSISILLILSIPNLIHIHISIILFFANNSHFLSFGVNLLVFSNLCLISLQFSLCKLLSNTTWLFWSPFSSFYKVLTISNPNLNSNFYKKNLHIFLFRTI